MSEDPLLNLVATSSAGIAEQGTMPQDLLGSAIDLLVRLARHGRPKVYGALFDTLLRAIELSLLGDGALVNVARFWDAYSGRREDIVTQRLTELLGQPPPRALASYVLRCLGSAPARTGRAAGMSDTVMRRVFVNYHARTIRKELRCSVCGYHFRRSDLGVDRLEVADDLGFVFAKVLD